MCVKNQKRIVKLQNTVNIFQIHGAFARAICHTVMTTINKQLYST